MKYRWSLSPFQSNIIFDCQFNNYVKYSLNDSRTSIFQTYFFIILTTTDNIASKSKINNITMILISSRVAFHFSALRMVITRHGESECNKKKVWSGWSEAKLTAKGEDDAA